MDATAWVTMIALGAMVLYVLPAVLRMNSARGTLMRNLGLWIAIFATLALGYRYFIEDRTPEVPAAVGGDTVRPSSPGAARPDGTGSF